MSIFYFKSEQFLPVDMNTAWSFFSSPKNLALITPPELAFQVKTELDEGEIYEGMLIEYIIKPLMGIPVRWKTEISRIQKPFDFNDRQVKGPYKVWEHTHRFIEKGNGVLMKDEIKYELPFGFIGNLAHSIIVRKKLAEIFSFRKQTLEAMFPCAVR